MKKKVFVLVVVVVLSLLSATAVLADGNGALVWDGTTVSINTAYFGLPFGFVPTDYTHANITPSGNVHLVMHWSFPYSYGEQFKLPFDVDCDAGFFLVTGQWPPSPMTGYVTYGPDNAELTFSCRFTK